MKMMKITPVTLILVLLISGCADNRIEVNQTVTEPKPEVDQTPKEPSLNDYLGNVTSSHA